MSAALAVKRAEHKGTDLDWCFPKVDPWLQPVQSYLVCQLRRPARKFFGSTIDKPDETMDMEQYETQIARVLLIGPGAFRNRSTGEPWPELQGLPDAQRVRVGSYVRIPKSGLERWYQPVADVGKQTQLVILRDTDLKGIWTGDPTYADTAKTGW